MNDSSGILERERSFLLQTYNRYPVVLARGKGIFLYDLEGRRYLDFVAGLGVNALGHAHPRIVKIIREQAARAIHLSNLYYNEYQGQLAEKLCGLSGLPRAFFSNSGTEAGPAGGTSDRWREQKPISGPARFLSRTNFWRYVSDRPGEIPQGVRTAAGRCEICSTKQY